MFKIAIDAGHGPETAGKRTPDDSMREFHFNSVVARYVRDLLLGYQGVEVLFTHADDGNRDVPLKERTDRVNKWGANVLVSIHANAMGNGWSAAGGIETFVYTSLPAESVKLASAVQRQLVKATGLTDRGVKTGDLHMVREPRMTAILCECGFMTNRDEAALLKSDTYRRKCAAAIVAGIVEVYGLKAKHTAQTGGKIDVEMTRVNVTVNGKAVAGGLLDAKAGVTYVPVRAVAEALGAAVAWDGKSNTAVIKGDK